MQNTYICICYDYVWKTVFLPNSLPETLCVTCLHSGKCSSTKAVSSPPAIPETAQTPEHPIRFRDLQALCQEMSQESTQAAKPRVCNSWLWLACHPWVLCRNGKKALKRSQQKVTEVLESSRVFSRKSFWCLCKWGTMSRVNEVPHHVYTISFFLFALLSRSKEPRCPSSGNISRLDCTSSHVALIMQPDSSVPRVFLVLLEGQTLAVLQGLCFANTFHWITAKKHQENNTDTRRLSSCFVLHRAPSS